MFPQFRLTRVSYQGIYVRVISILLSFLVVTVLLLYGDTLSLSAIAVLSAIAGLYG